MSAFRLVSKENLKQRAIDRRIKALESKQVKPEQERLRVEALESLHNGSIPNAKMPEGFNLSDHVEIGKQSNGAVAEFIGKGDFAPAWWERQRYEVEAGRDDEPILYPALYNVMVDANLPENITTYKLGPAGVVFQEIREGGEVVFATVGSSTDVVSIRHFGVGLRYSEDLFIYNQLFRMANIERQFGVAHNALLNHIHMNPILTFGYAAANQTDGTALTSFKTSATMPEKYLRAIEAAITNSVTDTTNRRPGPYGILCATADLFTIERALNRVPQQGFDAQSSAIGRVQSVIAYDGWTGTRGSKQVTYAGVTPGKAYLVDLSNRQIDFQSYFKHELRMQMGQKDLARFIMEETIWDVRFGVFADPVRAVEEITLPLAASGAA